MLLIYSIIISFLSSYAHGFTLSNSGRVYLPDPDVEIVVAGNTCSLAGFESAEELAKMVQDSVDEYWNRIPTCALKLTVSGVDHSLDTSNDTLSQAIGKVGVGKIIVGCSQDTSQLFSQGGILGVGSINIANGDRGVLLLNNADSSFANLTQQEKLATIAHELGHAFGLGHSSDSVALMYYSIGEKIQEKLSLDDYDACSYLYPHTSPTSCGSVELAGKGGPPGGGGPGPFLFAFAFLCSSIFLHASLRRNNG